MTQEEKQLLIKDLCARLLCRPKGVRLSMVFDPKDVTIVGYNGRYVETVDEEIEVERVRLYLRPMSSMTEEEANEWAKASNMKFDMEDGFFDAYDAHLSVDWLNSHHFDYRGLIDKGLALKAEDGMYKID